MLVVVAGFIAFNIGKQFCFRPVHSVFCFLYFRGPRHARILPRACDARLAIQVRPSHHLIAAIFEKLNKKHTVSLEDVKDICWELCEAQKLTQRLNNTKSVYYLTGSEIAD
jgi:hypothetical protein